MDAGFPVVFVRYWGSYFKSIHQVGALIAEFKPLLTRKWQCHLVLEAPPEEPAWAQMLSQVGIRLEIAPRPRSQFDWSAILTARRLFLRLGTDVMACDNIHTVPLVGAFLARVPVRIWNKRSMNSSYEECRVPRFRDRLLPSVRLSARLSTRILAVSVAVRDELVGLGVAADRVLVRYNPRSRQVPALPGSAALFRQAHGISKREIVIATVGHAVPVKAWDILIPAFAKVVAVEPRARLILAGSFDAAAERACHASLKRQVTELGVSSKVIFTGRLNNVWPLLQATDIFTLPSRSEGWGNVLIEALDAGLPCVVTRVGAARQVVVEGINGILVDREDVEDLSRALLRLAQDDMLRRTMAYNASVPAYIPTVDEFAEQLTRDYESQLASIFSRRQTSPLSRSET